MDETGLFTKEKRFFITKKMSICRPSNNIDNHLEGCPFELVRFYSRKSFNNYLAILENTVG
jgi:hypothetical protein